MRERASVDAVAGVQRLRETEVEHLHRAVRSHFDVGRLQIAMDDPLLVRGLERVGDLAGDREGVGERESAGSTARRDERASVSPSTSSMTRAVTSPVSSRR